MRKSILRSVLPRSSKPWIHNDQVDRAILADLDGEDVELARLDERQYLKLLEDAVDEAASILAHTRDTAEKMRATIRTHRKYTVESPALEDHALIDRGFEDIVQDLRHHEAQTKTLHNKVRSASELVISQLLFQPIKG